MNRDQIFGWSYPAGVTNKMIDDLYEEEEEEEEQTYHVVVEGEHADGCTGSKEKAINLFKSCIREWEENKESMPELLGIDSPTYTCLLVDDNGTVYKSYLISREEEIND